MRPELEAWALFSAAVFLLMGVNLGLGAAGHAAAALAWMRGLPGAGAGLEERQCRRLVWSYRAGGAAFAAFGLWLLWALARDPARLAVFESRHGLGPAGRVVGGLFFLCCGSLLAALQLSATGDKVARWTGRLMALAFLVFGAYLIRRAAG